MLNLYLCDVKSAALQIRDNETNAKLAKTKGTGNKGFTVGCKLGKMRTPSVPVTTPSHNMSLGRG